MNIKWSEWESLGKPAQADIGKPVVQRNPDGRLEVFGTAKGDIVNIWQVHPNGAWRDGWLNKGRPSSQVSVISQIVGRNADGRLEIFALGTDHVPWQRWQVAPNNGWSEWQSLGSPSQTLSFTEQFTVGRNQDGRQEVFFGGSDGHIWQKWQTEPNGGWSDWKQLGKPPVGIRTPDRFTVGRNGDGRQQLFVMGSDDALWHIAQQAPNLGWAEWQSLGKPRDLQFPEPQERDLFDPVVQENPDTHLEIFAVGNGAFCNRWQESPNSHIWRHEGWNAKPRPRPDVGLIWLEAAIDASRQRLEVLGLADDNALWHAWQIFQPPFWSQWHTLGSPPPGIRTGERLTVGTNHDHRLEAFVVGQDGAVWHTRQTA
jgi:hypothetical protein